MKFVHWEPNCTVLTDGRTYGQTDMTKLIAAFQNFAKTLINWVFVLNKQNVSCYALRSLVFKSPNVAGEFCNCCLLSVSLLNLRISRLCSQCVFFVEGSLIFESPKFVLLRLLLCFLQLLLDFKSMKVVVEWSLYLFVLR